MKGMVAIIVAATILIAPPHSAAAARSAEGAIQWAQSQIGSQEWNSWCLTFVRVAFQGRTSANYAYAFFLKLGQPNRGTVPNSVPRGALAFFGPTTGNPYGHVGLSLGGGQMINAVAWGKLAGIRVTPITFAKNFVGWAYPPADWSGREPATPSPAPATPTPRPTVTPEPAPQSFRITVNFTRSGLPVRGAFLLYLPAADFCARWDAAVSRGGQFPERVNAVATNIFTGTFIAPSVPSGTYIVVIAGREAPGGNWFWPTTLDCARARPLVLDRDVVLDFDLPG